jgi:hypothetical protein
MSRHALTFVVSLVALALAAALGGAAPATGGAKPFPASIQLPPGFQPEGIAIRGQTF